MHLQPLADANALADYWYKTRWSDDHPAAAADDGFVPSRRRPDRKSSELELVACQHRSILLTAAPETKAKETETSKGQPAAAASAVHAEAHTRGRGRFFIWICLCIGRAATPTATRKVNKQQTACCHNQSQAGSQDKDKPPSAKRHETHQK